MLALAASLSGADDMMAVFQWGRRPPPEALFLPGLERAPCHATYHHFFKALGVDAVEQALGAWVHEHGPGDHLALDGKRPRGSAPGGHDGRGGVHLVSAFASRREGVVGQLRVPPDGGEITAALALLEGLPLAGTVVTGDAAFCRRAICQTIRDRDGACLFAVKAGQPELMADIATAFGDAFPPELTRALRRAPTPPEPALRTAGTVEKGHGRIETRTLSASHECVAHLGWPGARQVCRIARTRETGGRTSREIACAVTSLPPEQAGPDWLLGLWRDHRLIENGLHRRRDVVAREDHSRVRSGSAPQTMATIRDTTLFMLRGQPGSLRTRHAARAEQRTTTIKAAIRCFFE